MTVLVVDNDWKTLRDASDVITRESAAVTVVLKSSGDAATQFILYNPVDLVLIRLELFSEVLLRKIKALQPIAECHILGARQNITPFCSPMYGKQSGH